MKNVSASSQSKGRKNARPSTDSNARPKATTYRLDPAVQESLLKLQRFLNVPQNRLVNEAVKVFVEQRTTQVVAAVEDLLTSVRQHRNADPNFDAAIANLVNAEANFAAEDTLEGSVVIENFEPAQAVAKPAKTRRTRRKGFIGG